MIGYYSKHNIKNNQPNPMDYPSLILLSLNNTQAIFPLFHCQAYCLKIKKKKKKRTDAFLIKDYRLFCNGMWFLHQKLYLISSSIVHNLTLLICAYQLCPVPLVMDCCLPFIVLWLCYVEFSIISNPHQTNYAYTLYHAS